LEQVELQSSEPAEALLRGDLYLIPADDQIEPIRDNEHAMQFTGPMSERSSYRQSIPFFEVKNEYPRIYITIGGGAERGQLERFFNRLIELFDKTEFRVLVSTGRKLPAKMFANRSANMFFVDWLYGM
jgi:UDP:flavonoid glycosyltransferase YjiC (YdhE family)